MNSNFVQRVYQYRLIFCTLSKKLSPLKTQQISKLSQFFPKNSGYLSKTQFSGNKKSNLKDDLLHKNAKKCIFGSQKLKKFQNSGRKFQKTGVNFIKTQFSGNYSCCCCPKSVQKISLIQALSIFTRLIRNHLNASRL